MSKADIIATSGNISIVKLTERHFPGILIQGDTMNVLFGDIQEMLEEIQSDNIETGTEIAIDIEQKIRDWILFYQITLKNNGYEIPFKE